MESANPIWGACVGVSGVDGHETATATVQSHLDSTERLAKGTAQRYQVGDEVQVASVREKMMLKFV